MEKRFILAVFLMVLILIVFNSFNVPTSKDKASPEEEETLKAQIEKILKEAVYEPVDAQVAKFNLPLYTALVSENGGIKSFRLRNHHVRKAGIPNIEEQLEALLRKARNQGKSINPSLVYSIKRLRYTLSYLRNAGEQSGVELISFSELYHNALPPSLEIRDQNDELVWREQSNYKLSRVSDKKVQLVQEIPDIGTLRKEFTFKPDVQLVDVKVTLENTGADTLQPHELLITCGPDIGIEEGVRTYTSWAPVAFVDGRVRKEEFGRGSGNQTVEKMEYGNIGWVALQSKYFSKILIPKEQVSGAYISKNQYEEHTVGIKTDVPSLQPGGEKEFSFAVYLGPKQLEDLNLVGMHTAKIIDHGVFGNLFHIVHILKFFYKLTHNYGLAIILLTVLILFPLSLKSFRSMKDMRKLQPEMERLRKQFKDDPQAMNKEVMELYRRHKINPLGGCLPMLLQFPILIGLFMTLRSVVELRGAPFVLWIKDLSLPDALFTLPFSIPFLGADVNVLPLLMTGVTLLQQKVSGSGGSSKMMMFFPVFLLFIFYNFPSGLVLYFLCSNIMNVSEQLWINRPITKKA
jgi:YidC/Oxa1 family membrane protein insertase